MKIIIGLFFLTLIQSNTFAKSYLKDIFKVQKPILAALYLKLPENLTNKNEIQSIIDYGVSQVKILERQKVDSVLWEYSYGDIMTPLIKDLELEVMALIINEINKSVSKLVIGVEILWHYPYKTLDLAQRTKSQYVRMDFFSDYMIAGGVEVPIAPQDVLAYRKKIGAQDIVLLTDIQVKYAKMINKDITIYESAKNAIQKGSNAVVVSGQKSGHPPKIEKIRDAKSGAGEFDLVLGSGTNYKNVVKSLEYADGVIIGTSISKKTGGPLDEKKVEQFMKVIFQFRDKFK